MSSTKSNRKVSRGAAIVTTKSEQVGELFTALSKFQGEITNAHKGTQGHGYSYADLASILDMVKAHLAENGLSVVQMPSQAEHGYIAVETLVAHSSGQWIEQSYSMPIPENKRNSAAQNMGSAITYARRYALAAALGIAQTDDDASLNTSPALDDVAKQWIAAAKANPDVLNQIEDKAYRDFIAKELTK